MKPLDYDWDGTLFVVFSNFSNFFLVFANFLFIFAGYLDFKRRWYMTKAFSAMIQPFKATLSTEFLKYPTVNICCENSIRAWLLMRTAALDLGRKYLVRVFMYCSFFLGLYTFYLIVFLLNYFGFLGYNFPLILNAYAIFDISIVLFNIFLMFLLGAFINY